MNRPALDLPPPLNNAFAQWVQAQSPTLGTREIYEICRYMHNQFTQFNEKSALQVVGERLITNRYRHDAYGQAIRKPIKTPAPGLRNRLRRFWTKAMPESYWRALRERFPHLDRRADGYTYGSIADPDAMFTRTIELKRVGFHQHYPVHDLLRGNIPADYPSFDGEFEFMVGYEALTDTLYLHERVWIRTGQEHRYGYPNGR